MEDIWNVFAIIQHFGEFLRCFFFIVLWCLWCVCVCVFMWLCMCAGVILPEHTCGIRGHTRCQSLPPIVWKGLWCFYACQALWLINLQGFNLSLSVQSLANFACKFDWIKEWLGVSATHIWPTEKINPLRGSLEDTEIRGGLLGGVLLCCPGSFLYPPFILYFLPPKKERPCFHLLPPLWHSLHNPTGSDSHEPTF